MNFDLKSTLKIIIFSFIFLLIIGYSIFEFRWIIQGPILEVTEPLNGQSSTQSLIEIRGTTKNIKYLGLNDLPITVDTSGNFKEELLLSPGYNIIKVGAKDRFDREKILFIEVFYEKSEKMETSLNI